MGGFALYKWVVLSLIYGMLGESSMDLRIYKSVTLEIVNLWPVPHWNISRY